MWKKKYNLQAKLFPPIIRFKIGNANANKTLFILRYCLCDFLWLCTGRLWLRCLFPTWSVKVRILYFIFYHRWCTAVHWAVQRWPCRCSIPLPFSGFFFLSLSFLYRLFSPPLSVRPSVALTQPNGGLSPISLQSAPMNVTAVPKKVITCSRPPTPWGQIRPFVVHIKAITFPWGWGAFGGVACLLVISLSLLDGILLGLPRQWP